MPSAAPGSRKPSPSRADALAEEPDLDFDPEHRVGHLLRRAYSVAKANTSAGLRELGITPMQAAAMMALRRAGTMSQAELGRAIGMERANIHGLVARMQKLEIVATAPDPTDARQVRIVLSAAGMRHTDEIARASAASAETTLAPLTTDERATLIALLGKIGGLSSKHDSRV